jgi:hypothetical protein
MMDLKLARAEFKSELDLAVIQGDMLRVTLCRTALGWIDQSMGRLLRAQDSEAEIYGRVSAEVLEIVKKRMWV